MTNQDINLQQHLDAALDIVNQAGSEQTGGQWLENLTTDVAPQINEPVVKAVLGRVVKLLRQVSISLIFVIPTGVGAEIACRSNAVLPPIHIGSCFRRNDGAI